MLPQINTELLTRIKAFSISSAELPEKLNILSIRNLLDILAELGIKEEDLFSELSGLNFICPISYCIMDSPVHIGQEKTAYNLTSIMVLFGASNSALHPILRTPISRAQISEAQDVAGKIKTYLSTKVIAQYTHLLEQKRIEIGLATSRTNASEANTNNSSTMAGPNNFFHNSVPTSWKLAELVATFPMRKEEIYQEITAGNNFLRFTAGCVYNLELLVKHFPEHKEELYQKLNNKADFLRYTGGSIGVLAKLVEIFPEHKEELYQRVRTANNIVRFTGYNSHLLGNLVAIFPEHQEEINTLFVNNPHPGLHL